MKLVFATHNPNKLKEIQQMVPAHIEIVGLAAIGCTTPIPETATTLEGNAKLKADFVAKNYNLSCFADDTGLITPALQGEPGVYSARYAGEENNAEANMQKLLTNLEQKEDRTAYFKTVIAFTQNGQTTLFEGTVHGEITKTKIGKQGFGYDPIFKPNGYQKTFGQLPLKIKNKISHRGKAFRNFIDYLNTLDARK